MPYNIQPDRGTVESPDYVLVVKSSDGKKDASVLYCLDSHSYSKLPDVKGYDWLTFDQVNWYRQQSAAFTAKNDGKPLPALAFFHIPCPNIMKRLPMRMLFSMVRVWKKLVHLLLIPVCLLL